LVTTAGLEFAQCVPRIDDEYLSGLGFRLVGKSGTACQKNGEEADGCF